MTDDELRHACEKLARQVCDYSFYDPRHIQTTKDDNVAILLRFARQQQAVAYQDIDARIGIGGLRIEYMRSSNWEIEFRELADYVHAKAKESHDEKHT